jgi:5-methyltetrahydrofolate--homocysteine methyltransferase
MYVSLEEARKNPILIDWDSYEVPVPKNVEVGRIEDFDLSLLVEYIDWTPFFISWQLAGKYPAILEDKIVGSEAQRLFNDAQSMLKRIFVNNWLRGEVYYGLFPCNSEGDDIIVYDKVGGKEIKRLHHLRQQRKKASKNSNYCLSDFIAPVESGKVDYIGGFAVTSGIGIEKHVKLFEEAHDDYNAILLKALADRLAEAIYA